MNSEGSGQMLIAEKVCQQLPDISFFHSLADAARSETLPRFRSALDLHVDTKPLMGCRFDPVTDADREAERVIRNLIQAEFPWHAITGEEFGQSGSGPVEWVLDPVDGTRPFLCGIPVWGTLIGLLQEGQAVMGMMDQPYTQERFWSDGKASWVASLQGQSRLSTRRDIEISQAILHTTSPDWIELHPSINFKKLSAETRMTRFGGECYAMAMVAAGKIDICFEPSLKPYDIVALIPIIEKAGGVVTALDGSTAEKGGRVIACGCPRLHEHALSILNS